MEAVRYGPAGPIINEQKYKIKTSEEAEDDLVELNNSNIRKFQWKTNKDNCSGKVFNGKLTFIQRAW